MKNSSNFKIAKLIPAARAGDGIKPEVMLGVAHAPARAPESDFLPVKAAVEYLRCSKSFLDKLRVAGGGPEFLRLSARKILYRRHDLDNWARQRRFESTAQYLESK